MNEASFVTGALAAVATPVVVAGLVGLLGSTVWHRMVKDKSRVVDRSRALVREV